MPAGRPAISDEEKQLQGTFRRDRQQAMSTRGSGIVRLTEVPGYPEKFEGNEIAIDQWQYVCEELFSLKVLRPIMLHWIELYCIYLSDCFKFREMAEAEEWVTQFQNADGVPTNEAISKYVTLSDGAYNKAMQTLKMLCLDQATAVKLIPKESDKPKSRFQQMREARNNR